jgi:hypothetical protein
VESPPPPAPLPARGAREKLVMAVLNYLAIQSTSWLKDQ